MSDLYNAEHIRDFYDAHVVGGGSRLGAGFCRAPGALDGGTHILAVVRRTLSYRLVVRYWR